MPVTISELDTAVTDLVASFTNLVKAARFTDESADTRKQRVPVQDRVPGELMEVLAEKVVSSAQAMLGLVGQLKRDSLPTNYASLNRQVAEQAQSHSERAASQEKEMLELKAEVANTLQELETHFYSSKHTGLLPETPAAQVQEDLKTLYKLAADVP